MSHQRFRNIQYRIWQNKKLCLSSYKYGGVGKVKKKRRRETKKVMLHVLIQLCCWPWFLMKIWITYFYWKYRQYLFYFLFHQLILNVQKVVHNKYKIERTDWLVGMYFVSNHALMFWKASYEWSLKKERSLGPTVPLINLKNILITINTVPYIMCQFKCNLNYVWNAIIVY